MLSLDPRISGVSQPGLKLARFSELGPPRLRASEGRVRTLVASNTGAVRISEIASGRSRVSVSNSLTAAIARLSEITRESAPGSSSSAVAAEVGYRKTVTAFRATSFTVVERDSPSPWHQTTTSSHDPIVAEIRAGDYVIATVHAGGPISYANDFAWLVTAAGIGAPEEDATAGRALEESRLNRLIEALSSSLIPTSNGFVGLAVTQATSLSGVAKAYRADSG
jgi:hypothetical protein